MWRSRRSAAPAGVPGRALVVSYGGGRGAVEAAEKNLRRQVKLDVRVISPLGGEDRDAYVKDTLRDGLAWLLEEGMEIPVRLDPQSGDVLEIDSAALEQELAPRAHEHDAARKQQSSLRYQLPSRAELRHVRELPGDLLGAARAIKHSIKEPPPDDGGLAPDDPSLAPIEGVDFDTWVEVQAAIVRGRVRKRDHDTEAQRHGVPPGRWRDIERAWRGRLAGNPALAQRFGTAYQRSVRER